MVEESGETTERRLTKYDLFRAWSKKIGILGVENVEYPHMFGDEKFKYPGTVAKRDIKHRESIIAVPFNLFISDKNISEELKELMSECPSLFSAEETTDSEHLKLAVYFMQEIQKGMKSPLYPYL